MTNLQTMLTSTEKVNSASSVTQFDVSPVVPLRQGVGRAATSLKIIGFLSAFVVLVYLSDYVGYLAALLCAVLIPGLATSTAKRLRSGSVRAAAVAAIWGLLWLGWNAVDAFPKSLKNGFSASSILGFLLFLLPVFYLAWGLVAFIRYRQSTAHAANNSNLMAHPWDEGLRMKVRPRFLDMKRGAAVLFLLLSPLPYLVFWVSRLGQDVNFTSDVAEQVGVTLGSFLVMLVPLYWGVRIYRRARREAMLPGSALVKKDERPIVLYLRSFHDDSALRMRARAGNGRILPEKLLRVSFEEVVCDHLWGYGPVLAIGDPQTKGKTAPLGAARDYATDSGWQDQVAQLMRQASMIVAVAGQTKGLVWEIDTVVSQGFLPKFVLLLPPVESQELEARWRFLGSNAPSLSLPADIEYRRARAVIFPEGRATLIYGDKRNDWTYEAVLDQAAFAILGTPQSLPVTSPVTQTGQFFRQLAPELSIFARSALVFLAIGALVFVTWGANQIHMESSHPYAHPGKVRDDFIPEFIKGCREKNAALSEDARTRYCSCYANRIAAVVTYGELQALEASKRSTLASVSDLKASFNEKAQAAASACSKETLGK